MMTDDENDATYVVHGHVVCGLVCYDSAKKEPTPPLWYQQLLLPLHLETG